LGTTCAAPIYFECSAISLSSGSGKVNGDRFLKASVLFTAAAAAHHATLLFGSFFFAVPVLVLVFLDRQDDERVSASAFVGRTAAIGGGCGRGDCRRASSVLDRTDS